MDQKSLLIQLLTCLPPSLPPTPSTRMWAGECGFCQCDWQRRKFKKRELEAFDELRHKREIKRIDRVAGKVVIWIPKEGRIGDHQRPQPCIPERGVITQACFRQNLSIEGQEKRLDWQISVRAKAPQNCTS
jgi:hypothetical protein